MFLTSSSVYMRLPCGRYCSVHACLVLVIVVSDILFYALFFFRCLVICGFTNNCNDYLVSKVKILGTTLSGSSFLVMLDEQLS